MTATHGSATWGITPHEMKKTLSRGKEKLPHGFLCERGLRGGGLSRFSAVHESVASADWLLQRSTCAPDPRSCQTVCRGSLPSSLN